MKTKTDSRTILKRAGIALLVFILAYAVISVIASAIVYNVIFENIPEGVAPFGYRYTDFADDYPRRSIEFESGKNTLRGYMYGEGGEKGLLIYANGVGSTAENHLAEIMFFVDDGWQVLIYNGTGVGESDGRSMVGLSQFRLDLLSAVEYAKSESSLPIVVYGHSAGGYAAASSLGDSDIAGAVSVAGFNSPTETMFYKAWEYVGVLADMEKPFLMLQHWFVFGGDGYIDAIDEINSTDTPVAVYAGDADTTVPYPMSLFSHKAESTNANAVFTETDGGHADIWLSDDAREYTAELTSQMDGLGPDDLEDFLGSVDYDRANALDCGFMREVSDFLSHAVELRK